FIERGFIHRNKIKTGKGTDFYLTIPIQKKERSNKISDIILEDNDFLKKHWLSIANAYKNSFYYKVYKNDLYTLFNSNTKNLSDLLFDMLLFFSKVLNISCKILRASDLDFKLLKSDLLMEHMELFNGDILFCGTLGKNYVNVSKFYEKKMMVEFQNYNHPVYNQRFFDFIPNMCILDLIFNVKPELLQETILHKNINKQDLKRKYDEYIRNYN
ncbi:MAG TPA: WbqC family protein, partial [Candidatus Cloacimonadota bacterium]|nr:WbqC family protein [Candidatus Cloacimonadota bacterium]